MDVWFEIGRQGKVLLTIIIWQTVYIGLGIALHFAILSHHTPKIYYNVSIAYFVFYLIQVLFLLVFFVVYLNNQRKKAHYRTLIIDIEDGNGSPQLSLLDSLGSSND